MTQGKMPFTGKKPRTLLAQEQEGLLETFINVKQYDKLLFFLESTLFNNAPTLNCPSPFVLNYLFTLATIGHYNNADLIRRDFGKSLSLQPIHVRAVNILKRLVKIVQDSWRTGDDELFNKTQYNEEDVLHARDQLIGAIRLIRNDRGRFLRRREGAKEYREKELELDEFQKSVSDSDRNVNFTDWSPQKKLLEKSFSMLKETKEEESESESEGDGMLDRKSYYILRNERFDVALHGDMFWNAVTWALKCSSTKDLLHNEAWKLWKPILELVFSIVEFEFDDFISRKVKDKEDEFGRPPLFINTLFYNIFIRAGKQYPVYRIVEIIFTNSKTAAKGIFVGELSKSKSVYLPEVIGFNNNPDGEFTWESMKLRKQIFHLLAKAIEHADNEDDAKQHRWSPRDLARNTTLKLMDLSYSDFRLFFALEREEINIDYRLQIVLDIIFDYFVQINKFEFDLPDSTWIYDQNTDILEMFLTRITYQKNYYIGVSKEGVDVDKMASDYAKLNLALFILLNLWSDSSGSLKIDSANKKKKIVEWCQIGEAERRKALESANPEGIDIDNDLFNLTETVKLQYSQTQYSE